MAVGRYRIFEVSWMDDRAGRSAICTSDRAVEFVTSGVGTEIAAVERDVGHFQGAVLRLAGAGEQAACRSGRSGEGQTVVHTVPVDRIQRST